MVRWMLKYHCERRFGRFFSFMSMGATYALYGLVFVFNGEQTENYGCASQGIELGYALRDALAYVVEVGSVASYNASKHYYRIGVSLSHGASGGIGEFDGAGHLAHIYVAWVNAEFYESVYGATFELGGDVGVP